MKSSDVSPHPWANAEDGTSPGCEPHRNICALFGCGAGGEYEPEPQQETAALTDAFRQRGGRVVCNAEYDVRLWFLDVESLPFGLKGVPLPEDFDIEDHWRTVDRIITEYGAAKGIETNEHRELLIVQKP